ncbi:hypothetical protein THAOC_32336 [Thalassiosira oceanica]|uniref:Uncharacterized protein n=1 Tax=Thalassiosira oceanica TaxID=159749 RepID=K0RIU6_THAOC|nr:hypothetical protein THAOC_32336 [Thalassiosira oceanica]|eukprot:EJK48836.1 hypothetical protein THAOC_32336 [Thalassiosira oceanica]
MELLVPVQRRGQREQGHVVRRRREPALRRADALGRRDPYPKPAGAEEDPLAHSRRHPTSHALLDDDDVTTEGATGRRQRSEAANRDRAARPSPP